MEHKYLPLKALRRNEGQIEGLPTNPREWSKAEIERLKKSIRQTPELMEARGIIVYPHKGEYIILGGNMRYTALSEMKVEQAPCIVLPEGMPIEKLKEIVIKDNGSFGSWDYDLLANEWDELPLTDWGVPAWETTNQEEEATEVVEDDFNEEENDIPARVSRGDVWQLGNHRLMCGDSTDAGSVALLMNGEKADISFTSPPYNAGDSEKLSGNTHFEESKYKGYDDNNEDYKDLIVKSTKNSLEVSRYCFVNLQLLAGNKTSVIEYTYELRSKLCDVLIWKKTGAPVIAKRVCNSEYEFVFVFSNENNSRSIGTREFRGTESNVFVCSPQRNNEFASEHAATFSVEFVSHYIKSFCNKGEKVLDLFGGTGTTMIAAEQLGRKCYMMELNPHYCDIIIARWEAHTGKTALKLE